MFPIDALRMRSPATSGDPYWASTKLLCGCNGIATNAADLDDESFANHANGLSGGSGAQDATYSSSTKMFGNTAVYFDTGFNDYVRFADHADWTLGTQDFTLEFFWCCEAATQLTRDATIMGHTFLSTDAGWLFQFGGSTTPKTLGFFGSDTGSATFTTLAQANFSVSLLQWYYICVERSGTTFRMYLGTPGGTASMVDKRTSSLNIFNTAQPLQISGQSSNDALCMGGVYMDEIRLTSVARYATDAGFPVPSAAFPRG